MKKLTYRLMTILVTGALALGNFFSTGASSALALPSQAATAPLAFPEAEGFGANTIGGRGGAIIEVTNLNDSGMGSLRACVQASGARTCVFRTGGLIVLQSPLKIVNPYITIAGQTAPGGGITLKLGTASDVFLTQTHDVIIRYLTIRPGPGGENHGNQIAKSGTELYNIIIDHNSLSWGVDSNIETWYRVQGATIQWSLISEGLDNSTHSKGAHSKGIMIGGYKGSDSGGKGSENISVLNNLMAHNADRNPLMQMCGIAQVINNVTYNPTTTFSHQQLNCLVGESYVNWINNYHKKGPSSGSDTDLKIIPADSGEWSLGKVYVEGNIGPGRPNDNLPETDWVEVKSGAPAGVIVTSPAPAPLVYSTNAVEAYNRTIANGGAGNSQGLDCDGNWINRRDSIDARVINEVKTGTGGIIDDPSDVGGWIVPAAGVPCADGDHDGMPDAWEQTYGFDPNRSDGSVDRDGDGYTNVEEYLNGTDAGDVPSTPWTGSVSITSNKKVVSVGRPHIGSEVASYVGFSAGALTAYIPMLFKNAFGGSYDFAFYIQNVHTSKIANIRINYYDRTGALICTIADALAPLSSTGYWVPGENCLPDGWVGGAVVTSDQPIVAIGRPHIGAEVMTYNGFSSGSLTSYIPMLFKGAFNGSYDSAFYIQNVDPSNTASVTINFYDKMGVLSCAKDDVIEPFASIGYWTPGEDCLPAGWIGSAVVTSDRPIVAVGRPHIGSQITTYIGFSAGTGTSYVPMLFKNAFGGGSYKSAFYVQNVNGSNVASITIRYYDEGGNLTCTMSDSIDSHASKGYWVPGISCLPDGWVGGAVVTSDQPIVAVGRPHIGARITTYNGFTSGNLNSYLPMLFKDYFDGSYDSALYIQNTEASAAAVTINFYDSTGALTCTRNETLTAFSTFKLWMPDLDCLQ